MKFNLHNLSKLGFASANPMTRSKSVALLYRQRGSRIEFTSGYATPCAGYFELTPEQLREFQTGKLSLVPPGFCSVGTRATLENAVILHQGEVRTAAELETIFAQSHARPLHPFVEKSRRGEQPGNQWS